jgi:hypothetical protein
VPSFESLALTFWYKSNLLFLTVAEHHLICLEEDIYEDKTCNYNKVEEKDFLIKYESFWVLLALL